MSSDEREEFAVAQYKKLSDSDKLSAPSFERMKSGLRFSTGDASEYGARVVCEVDYELSYVHRSRGLIIFAGVFKMFGSVFSVLAAGSSAVKSAFSQAKKGAASSRHRSSSIAASISSSESSDLAPIAGLTGRHRGRGRRACTTSWWHPTPR